MMYSRSKRFNKSVSFTPVGWVNPIMLPKPRPKVVPKPLPEWKPFEKSAALAWKSRKGTISQGSLFSKEFIIN